MQEHDAPWPPDEADEPNRGYGTYPAAFIKEEPLDEEDEDSAGEGAGMTLAISDFQGNAEHLWSQVDIDEDFRVKQEPDSDGEQAEAVHSHETETEAVYGHESHEPQTEGGGFFDLAVVKQERKSDEDEGEEEEGRAQLFGGQFDSYEDDGGEVVHGTEEADVEEELPPRSSTTLHPADDALPLTLTLDPKTKAKVTQHVKDVVQKYKAAQASARATEGKTGPKLIESPPMPKRQAHQRAISYDRAVTLHQQQTSPTSPGKRRSSDDKSSSLGKRRHSDSAGYTRREHSEDLPTASKKMKASPPTSPTPSPTTSRHHRDSSSSDDSCSKRQRVAHKPPSWYQTDLKKENMSPDTRSRRSSASCSDMDLDVGTDSPEPDVSPRASSSRLLTDQKPKKVRPPPALAKKQTTQPASLKQEAKQVEFKKEESSPDSSSSSRSNRSNRSSPRPGPSGTQKPKHLAFDSDSDEDYVRKPPPIPKTIQRPSRDPRLQKPCPASKKKPLPLLPPASHFNMSPQYESRSPLCIEDYKEPRKSYSCAESSESKGGPRPISRPSWLDNVLYHICRWKPEWLEESKKVSPKKVPKLFHTNMEDYESARAVTHFKTREEYLKYFQEGLLFELWETMTRSRKGMRSTPWLLVGVDSTPQDQPLLGNRKRRTYICHCGSNIKKPLALGDLVLIQVKEKTLEKPKKYFAYVDGVQKTKILSDSVKLSPDLLDLLKERQEMDPTFKCAFKLTMCCDDFSEEFPNVWKIKKIKNLYEEIEMFKFLSDCDNSNLFPQVLSPVYEPRADPQFCLKMGSHLGGEQKQVVLSVIQDILHYETPSINVVEGGAGTGKTVLAATLAQELVESKNKYNRECYVVISARSNAQLDIILGKLQANHWKSSETKDPDAFRAVWLGRDQSLKGCERLEKIEIGKLCKRHISSQDSESFDEKLRKLKKKLSQTEKKAKLCQKKMKQVPIELKSLEAKLNREILLVNSQSEKEKASALVKREEDALNLLLKNCDIFLTTLGCHHYRSDVSISIQKYQRKRVVLIVDDASEVTEPAIIKLMVTFSVTDVILLGDTKQHTPYVSSRLARNAGLVVPLMTRYTRALNEKDCAPPHRSLTKSYRMHPEILTGINEVFYGNSLKPVDSGSSYFRPYVWFNCTFISDQSEKFKEEAQFVEKLVSAIEAFKPFKISDEKKRICVLSYSNEISTRLARSSISKYCEPTERSSMECDIMIISVGPSSRIRMNKTIVSLTRARRCLFVCGSFSEDTQPSLLGLLKDAKSRGVLEDITESDVSKEELMKKIKSKK